MELFLLQVHFHYAFVDFVNCFTWCCLLMCCLILLCCWWWHRYIVKPVHINAHEAHVLCVCHVVGLQLKRDSTRTWISTTTVYEEFGALLWTSRWCWICDSCIDLFVWPQIATLQSFTAAVSALLRRSNLCQWKQVFFSRNTMCVPFFCSALAFLCLTGAWKLRHFVHLSGLLRSSTSAFGK